jgi:hypothetical protein
MLQNAKTTFRLQSTLKLAGRIIPKTKCVEFNADLFLQYIKEFVLFAIITKKSYLPGAKIKFLTRGDDHG